MDKIFTHTDLDGVGCAVLAKYYNPEIEVEFCDYDNVNQKVNDFLDNNIALGDLYITDISVSEEIAERLEYDTDFIDCTLWNGIAESTAEYCNKGDLIGVKGRLESKEREIEGKKIKVTNLIAEKVTFLTSKQKETENSNEMEV